MSFDVNTFAVASAMIVIGFQGVLFAFFTQVYASEEGFLPRGAVVNRLLAVWDLERVLLIGGLLALGGVAGLAASFAEWHGARFGDLGYVSTLRAYESTLRIVVPSVTALILSCQLILGAFFLSILGIRRARHPVGRDSGTAGIPSGVVQSAPASSELAEPTAGRDFSGELADA
jgi:hypothetical protein